MASMASASNVMMKDDDEKHIGIAYKAATYCNKRDSELRRDLGEKQSACRKLRTR